MTKLPDKIHKEIKEILLDIFDQIISIEDGEKQIVDMLKRYDIYTDKE